MAGKAVIFFFTTLFAFTGCQQSICPAGEWEKVTAGLSFPEGPSWDGKSTLYVSNCRGDWIAKIHNGVADTFLVRSEKTPIFGYTNGLLFHRGLLYACDFGTKAVLRITADKKITVLSTGTAERPFRRPNDIAIGPDGLLYVTDPHHYDRNNPDGAVYKIDPASGQTAIAVPNLAFPNGIAFSPDNRSLLICESACQRILKFSIDNAKIDPDPTTFIKLPGGDPDGIAFDKKGNLYLAHFGGAAVYIIQPDGKIAGCLKTPGGKPTNLEFGDKHLKTLYLTEVETNSVYRLKAKIQGLPLFK